MTEPEDALAVARAEAERLRAAGTYPPAGTGQDPEADVREVSTARLMEWALIEPDPRLMRSTRRHGAPITWLKRFLLRLLYQYHAELNAQQTRFNINLLARVRRLEDRLDELERDQR